MSGLLLIKSIIANIFFSVVIASISNKFFIFVRSSAVMLCSANLIIGAGIAMGGVMVCILIASSTAALNKGSFITLLNRSLSINFRYSLIGWVSSKFICFIFSLYVELLVMPIAKLIIISALAVIKLSIVSLHFCVF